MIVRSSPLSLVVGIILLLTLALPAGAQPNAPPRDARPQGQAGTGVIRGRILAGDTGRALRRARVTALAPGLGPGRSVGTDSDGAYEVTDLPAGLYRITVQRGGYLQVEYGQTRPLEQSRRIQLGEGQVVEHVDVAMPRASVISGRVTDELGEPIEGITVLALRQRFWEGERQLVPTASIFTTDDAGGYRVVGLAPGKYFIMAMTRDTWPVKQGGSIQVMGYAPTYYPGTVRPSDARAVTVPLGKEVGQIDVSLIVGRAVKISGVALDSQGRPFDTVRLADSIRGDNFGRFGGRISSPVASDGSFTLKDVTPGSYLVEAGTPRNSDHPEAAIVPVTVEDADITGLYLSGSQGGTISGRIISDSGQAPDIPRLHVTVGLPSAGQPEPMLLGTFSDPGSGTPSADGAFTIKGVFGKGPILVTLPDTWMVKSITYDGRELSDVPIELRSGETFENVLIVVTDRVSRVEGSVADEKGHPVPDATIVVFPAEPEKWAWQTRAIKAARPDKDGHFQMTGLPAGHYQAIAVDYIENGEWNDPEFLKSARDTAAEFWLTDAGAQTLSLRLAAAPPQR